MTEQTSQDDLMLVNAYIAQNIVNARSVISERSFQYLEKRLQGAAFVTDINGTLDLFWDEEVNPLDQFLCDVYDRGFPVIPASGDPSNQLQYEICTKIENADGVNNAIRFKPDLKIAAFIIFDDDDMQHRVLGLNGMHVVDAEAFLRAWGRLSEQEKNDALQPLAEFHKQLLDMDYIADVCKQSAVPYKVLKGSDIEVSGTSTQNLELGEPRKPARPISKLSKLDRQAGALKSHVNGASQKGYKSYSGHAPKTRRPQNSVGGAHENDGDSAEYHGDS